VTFNFVFCVTLNKCVVSPSFPCSFLFLLLGDEFPDVTLAESMMDAIQEWKKTIGSSKEEL